MYNLASFLTIDQNDNLDVYPHLCQNCKGENGLLILNIHFNYHPLVNECLDSESEIHPI